MTSHLQRGTLVHPASHWLTQSSQTLLLLGDKKRTILTDPEGKKTVLERALEGVSIPLEVAAARHENSYAAYRVPGLSYSCPSGHREEPLGLHLDTTRGNKSAQHNVDHKSAAILVCIHATLSEWRVGGGVWWGSHGGCSCLSCLSQQICNTCWNKCRGTHKWLITQLLSHHSGLITYFWSVTVRRPGAHTLTWTGCRRRWGAVTSVVMQHLPPCKPGVLQLILWWRTALSKFSSRSEGRESPLKCQQDRGTGVTLEGEELFQKDVIPAKYYSF